MSRLSSYLRSKDVAQLHLSNAESQRDRGDLKTALTSVIAAVRSTLTAQNNLASLAYEKRSKVLTRKPTLKVIKEKEIKG